MTANVSGFPLEPQDVQPLTRPARPFFWSLRRELWENRSIYLAPVAVAIVSLIGFAFSTIGMPDRRRAVLKLDPIQQRATIGAPYDVVAIMLFWAAFLIGAFYCLDALYGERRDRSILFWKSLPVSDLTTVLAKTTIPMIVLPAITWVIVMITQMLMMVHTTIVLLPSGLAATTWSRVHPIADSPTLLYGLVVAALWHAPIYAWFLLVSAWAKRATFLYAILPWFAIGVFSGIVGAGRSYGAFLQHRLFGGITRAFEFDPRLKTPTVIHFTPGKFLMMPGLWLGLLFAVACVVAAVRLRRNREPM